MAAMKPEAKGFDNDIKPTRLYNFTGRKHFNYLNRMSTGCRPRFDGRSKPEALLFKSIVMVSALGMMYAFGQLVRKSDIPKPKPVKKKPICKSKYPEVPLCSCEMTQAERDLKDCKRNLRKCKAAMFLKSLEVKEQRLVKASLEQEAACVCTPEREKNKECSKSTDLEKD